MFQLTSEEYEYLRSHFATSSEGNAHGGRRYMPYVFTEQGIAMLSAVLKSDVAVEVSIKIMNSFVEMRRFLFSNKEMFARLDRVELKQLETDKKLEEVFNPSPIAVIHHFLFFSKLEALKEFIFAVACF